MVVNYVVMLIKLTVSVFRGYEAGLRSYWGSP